MEPNPFAGRDRLAVTIVLFFTFSLSGCREPELSIGEADEPELAEPNSVKEQPEMASPPKPEAPPRLIRLPVERIIRDLDGRSLEVTIIGREEASITIVRKSDQKRFDFPIDQLQEEDRHFVESLRQEAAPREAKPMASPYEVVPVYVANRRAEIERLQNERYKLGEKLQSSLNKIEKRTLQREIDKMAEEIQRLYDQIKDYQKHLEKTDPKSSKSE